MTMITPSYLGETIEYSSLHACRSTLEDPTAGTSFGSFIDNGGVQPGVTYTATATVNGTVVPLTVTPAPGGGNNFSLTATATTAIAGGLDEGSSNYSLAISNTNGASAKTSGLLTVTDAPLTFVSTNPGIAPTEGAPLTSFPLMLFSDANPNATIGDFTGTIDWGDGTPSSPATFSVSGGDFLVSGNHTYADAGAPGTTFQITIKVSDVGGQKVSGTTAPFAVSDAVIANSGQPPIPVNAAEGQLVTGIAVGSFIDTNPDATPADYVAFINWGDGGPMDVAVITRVGMFAGNPLFVVTGSHSYAHAAGSPFTITATVNEVANPGGVPVSLSTTATVVQSPLAVSVLSFNASANVPAVAGQVIATFSDNAGGDPIGDYSAKVDWGDGTSSITAPGGLSIVPGVNPNTFNVVAPALGHTYTKPGFYAINVTVNDSDPAMGIGNGFASVATPALTVTPLVIPPVAATEGIPIPANSLVGSFAVGDPAAVAGNYRAVIDWGDGSPMSVGTITKTGSTATSTTFSVTGNHTYREENGAPYTITVAFSDQFGGTVSSTTSANVADAALSNGKGLPVFGGENQPLNNIAVATFVDANPLSTASDFTASILWGDGALPDTNTRVALVGGSAAGNIFAVYGSHVYTTVGSFTIGTTVLDKGGSSIAVTPVPANATISQSPIIVVVAPITATIDAPTAPTVVATFTDLSGGDPIGDYTATINWGDGSPTDTGVIASLGGGQYSVTAPSHAYHNTGAFALTVTVNDSDPAVGMGSALVFVRDSIVTATPPVGGPITGAVEGAPITATVAAFTDADTFGVPSDYTATIDWGDGSPQSAGTIIVDPGFPAGTGHFLVVGKHTYAEESATGFTVSTTVTDSFGAKTNTTATVNAVADAPLSKGTGLPVLGSENQPLYNIAVATFVDANPLSTASDFTASVLWGDGSLPDTNTRIALVGGSPAGNIFAVYGTHTFVSVGSYTIGTTVLDKGGSSITVTPAVANATIAQSPILVAVLPLTATLDSPTAPTVVATFVDNAGAGSDPIADYTATIDWGDGSATSTGVIASLGGGQYSVTGPAHTYHSTGAFVLRVTVIDSDPASGMAAGLVIVANSTITGLTPAGGPITGAVEGAPITATVAAFTDSDVTAIPADFTATIDWGDGSPQSAGTIISNPAFPVGTGHFLVVGTHTYAEESLTGFTVSTTITDQFGGKTNATATVNAVADAALSKGTGLPVFGSENAPLNNIPVATFVDANPLSTAADFTASILWGDGSLPDTNTRIALVGGSAAGNIFAVYGSHNFVLVGSYTIGTTVLDKGGSSITVTPAVANATIAQSPIIVTVGPLTATIDTPTAPTVVATFVDEAGSGSDPIADYTATIDWGDGSPTSTGVIAALGGGQYSVTAPAHTYHTSGAFVLKVTVNDTDPAMGIGAGLVLVGDSTITLSPAPGGPILTTEGAPLVNVPVATFTNSDPTATPGSFSAIIDWGDGSPASAGTVTQPGGPGTGFVVTGNHTYADESASAYKITVIVSDNIGGKATTSTSATVGDAALVNPTGIPEFSNDAQVLLNAPLGTFADNNKLSSSSDFLATINWGDGSPNTQGFVTLVGGNATQSIYSVSGTHDYSTPGVKNVVISVLDDGGSSTTINTTVTVSSTAVALSIAVPGPILATEGLPTAGGVIAVITDLPGDDPVTNFTATINYGDGSPLVTGTVVNNGNGTYNVIAPPHTFPEEGVYPVTVSVTDTDSPGAPFFGVALASVKDAPLTGHNGGTINVNEGSPISPTPLVTFTDANPIGTVDDFTATIFWGDGTSSLGVVSQPGGPGTVFDVSGNHVYPNDGTYPVTVSIVDVGGSTTTATATVNVAEVPVVLNPTPLSIAGYENTELTNVDVATFTVANPFETASSFVATINWGDGTASAGTIVEDASKVFHVEGNHTYVSSGKFFPVITIAETDGTNVGQTTAVATISFTPLIVFPAPVQGTEGISLPNAQNASNGTIVANFSDTFGADTLADYTATIDWGNGQITPGTIVPSGPNFAVVAPSSPAILYPEAGTYNVKVTITDSDSASGTPGFFQAITVTTATIADAKLTADPAQPVVNAFQQTPLVGANVSKFSDANPTAPLSDFTATIDWGDGTPESAGVVVQPGGAGTPFFVTGNHTYANPTTPPALPYVVRVSIHDVDGKTLTTTTSADVTASTITGAPVTFPAVESQPLSNVVVAYFSDSGIPGPLSSYSATIDWGTGAPSTIGTIVPLGGNQFAVEGSFTYLEENLSPSTPYSVNVTIDHNGTLATIVTSHAQVADAPISGVAIPVFATEGAAFKGTVAIFTDLDPNGTVTDYTATINWGDGSQSSGTVVANGASFLVQAVDPVSGLSHAYAEEGSYAFSVTVKDAGGSTFTAYQTATVADAALSATGLTLTAPEYPAFNGVIANFTDQDPAGTASDYTASIFWADGVSTPGTVTQLVTAPGAPTMFTVSGTHTFDEGTYPVNVVIKDAGGSTTSAVSILTITDSPLTAGAATAINAIEGKPFTLQTGTFTDANLNATIEDFSASIDWGDGLTSSAIIGQRADGTFTVTGTHTYVEESAAGTPYAIKVSIKDIGGSTATDSATATVGDAPLTSQGSPINGVEGIGLNPLTTTIATFTDSDPLGTASDFTAMINWGDGTAPTAGTVVPTGTSPGGIIYSVNGSHIYAEEGLYQTQVTVTDVGGSKTVAVGNAAITDAPLAAAATQPTVNTTEGISFTLPVASFTDSNPGGTVSDFKATIDWGDGTPRSNGTISQPGGPGTPFIVTGSHNYIDAFVNNGTGHFPILVNVTDKGGAVVAVNNTANVVNFPIAVTGNLDPSTDTGESHFDAITKDNHPRFYGTTEPYGTVQLFATATGTTNTMLIGQTQANGSGAWHITTNVLPDGSYTITAKAIDRSGVSSSTTQVLPNVTQGPLVIDTVGPKVTNVQFGRSTGQIFVTFQDDRSGMDIASIVDAANYSFTKRNLPAGSLLVTELPVTASGPTAPVTVAMTINFGKRLSGGIYTLTIHSGGPAGVQDVAGNAMDGEFYGFFPSGNNIPGGNFVAQLDAVHHLIFAPRTVIGTASPVVPPGQLPTGFRIPTDNHGVIIPAGPTGPATLGSLAKPAVRPAVQTAHDLALESVVVPKKHPKHPHHPQPPKHPHHHG